MSLTKAEKAKQMMYKRPALASLGYQSIMKELETISEECDEVRYVLEDDVGSIIDALDGDEEDAFEFRMMFSELSAECDMLRERIYENTWDEQEFDDMTVALIGNRYEMVGYDGYEEDWQSLAGYDQTLALSEAGKRVMRHTKSEMISMFGQAMGIMIAFLHLRQKYDYLKATMDIIRGEKGAFLRVIADIEKAYEEAEEHHFYSGYCKTFDELLAALPERTWLE